MPTLFNILGPLGNPARPMSMAFGVADVTMARLVADVLAVRGTRGLVFHGNDGLDELTTTTSSQVWVVRDGTVTEHELDPTTLGLARAGASDLTGGDAVHNAAVARDILAGVGGPVRDVVLLNAAAALLANRGDRRAPPRGTVRRADRPRRRGDRFRRRNGHPRTLGGRHPTRARLTRRRGIGASRARRPGKPHRRMLP